MARGSSSPKGQLRSPGASSQGPPRAFKVFLGEQRATAVFSAEVAVHTGIEVWIDCLSAALQTHHSLPPLKEHQCMTLQTRRSEGGHGPSGAQTER